ncbi:PAS domain S-box protein [Mucilaginibacter robiniae]|uniref:histidine kinase n=1 Tax=Mucilaginibacter robiniae TaxID=2728022 RepID=A0A7L5E1P8_9SPHI|nr:PAS domain-containing sensor histidine kinase [Mucilaginibacter robiniae]QJD94753.1 PAS domain S-box protein [Mucilaginibacter robiniae]
MFYAHTVFTTVYNENGHLSGFVVMVRNTDEISRQEKEKAALQAQFEKKLRLNTLKNLSNELRFRKLIENSYDGIALFDQAFRVIYRSISAERIDGWSNAEMLHQNMRNYTHPDDVDMTSNLLAEIYHQPFVPVIATSRVRHKQGHYIWIECVFTNMLEDENINAIVCNFKDITERRQAEIERKRITADLIQRNRDLEQFTYIISHNLRAPLANIMGLSDLLGSEVELDTDNQILAQALSASIKNLDQIILDLNHILQARNEVSDRLEQVDLAEIVEEINLSVNQMIETNQASIIYDFHGASGLLTIKSYLYSIFQNLIMNSIKYRRLDVAPVIHISSAIVNQGIRILFKDNGKGIDMARYGHQLFGLYKRFDKSVEGRGMGLFMVKMQVERLGGTISVQSEPQVGTEFLIEMPIA